MLEHKKDLNSNQKQTPFKIGSNKQFGLVFCVFFIVICVTSYLETGHVNIWLVVAACLTTFITLFYSNLLSKPNYYWSLLGIYLGRLTTPIILFLLFFCIFTPISFILKVLKKDLLNIKLTEQTQSYWHASVNSTDFTKQF